MILGKEGNLYFCSLLNSFLDLTENFHLENLRVEKDLFLKVLKLNLQLYLRKRIKKLDQKIKRKFLTLIKNLKKIKANKIIWLMIKFIFISDSLFIYSLKYERKYILLFAVKISLISKIQFFIYWIIINMHLYFNEVLMLEYVLFWVFYNDYE